MSDPLQKLLHLPTHAHLPAWLEALERGWTPSLSRPQLAQEQMTAIRTDPDAFLADLSDPDGAGPPVPLPDGSTVPRLPWQRWVIWNDGFCGVIDLRYQKGTSDLPPHVLGHVGYSVVPWRWREGLATRAMQEIADYAGALGLTWIEAAIDPENLASLGVMRAVGATLYERRNPGAAYGNRDFLFWRMKL